MGGELKKRGPETRSEGVVFRGVKLLRQTLSDSNITAMKQSCSAKVFNCKSVPIRLRINLAQKDKRFSLSRLKVQNLQ